MIKVSATKQNVLNTQIARNNVINNATIKVGIVQHNVRINAITNK